MHGVIPRVVLVVLAAALVNQSAAIQAPDERRMSFHNRLLLNRAVLAGLQTIDVLALAAASNSTGAYGSDDTGGFDVDGVSSLVQRLGGRVRWTDEPIGYVRAEVPARRLLDLAQSRVIASYQIASLSKASWYRDGPPLSNAEMYRGFEVTPVAAPQPDTRNPALRPLSVAESRASGFTLDEDAGVGAWLKAHPTFDGRGTTIALVENALPHFADPTFRTAKTLGGRDVAKIAGIVNAIDPGDPDETRVALDTAVEARTPWIRIGRRTFILPRPGAYRFGTLELSGGANVVHVFGVIEHRETHQVWIDSNGDASFADETPLADVNERFEPRYLQLAHPARTKVSFVMSRGMAPNTLHIYVGKGSHQTMTLSVAAGSPTNESLAYGVAPGARILLVRGSSQDYELSGILEGFIHAARRPDVDVVGASAGIKILTDTDADFTGTFFGRLISVYGKPVINAAGNFHLELASSYAMGASWTAGGVLGPATLAALHGSRPLDRLIVHPYGAAGPALDGAVKPDFLAPMERLATDVPWRHQVAGLPENFPSRSVPPGYQLSCCTSSASPYAAGLVALLISAAKQAGIPHSVERLDRALKLSARFIRGFPSHQQGNGALDIESAWRWLQHDEEPPRIFVSARIVHPLAQYAARGSEGKGIFEFEGWTAGMIGTRAFQFERRSGHARPIEYRVTWTGNDGTFRAPASIVLPVGKAVAFPVTIAPASTGVHSALLNLEDVTSGRVVFRTQATIVAAERFDTSTRSLRVSGGVPFMRVQAHYFEVPPATSAISIDFDVIRGALKPTLLPAHGLFPSYYLHVHPMNVRFAGKGRHTVVLPNPRPGTWTIQLENTSAGGRFGPDDTVATDDSDAEYAITVRLLNASVLARRSAPGQAALDVRNTGSDIREPVMEVSRGTLRTHHQRFDGAGFPVLVEIAVPEGASALSLNLRSDEPGTNAVELLLYDCTTDECFSYDLGFPAAASQAMLVRKPRAGRWVAAVSVAPFPRASGSFVLDEIIASGPPIRLARPEPLEPEARWKPSLSIGDLLPARSTDADIVFVQLLDARSEGEEAAHPWIPGPNARVLRDRPVALGTAIYRR